jgi:nitronate monooxygenase
MRLPLIIQGGMGVAVSDWKLARAVSSEGQLGVVSGTALDAVLARRLQLGDPGGYMRRALAAFPIKDVTDRILDRFFIRGGKRRGVPFKRNPMSRLRPSRLWEDLVVAGSFAEVWLARHGHRNPVGINFLEKIQAPMLPALYGAMLAGVSYVLVGAGIPRAIPGILDRLAAGEPVEMKLDVKGASSGTQVRFDPAEYGRGVRPPVKRPRFLAIVSSHVLATMLTRKVESRVDGFVVETPTAGGHNAPPRQKAALSESGEPVYGEKDVPDLAAFRELDLPFWMAGSFGRPEQLEEALAVGAAGIQVGTAFAYCEESGLDAAIKQQVLEAGRNGELDVFTDPVASPTGFPFKVLQMGGTLSDDDVYSDRDRVCDLGYLRTAFEDSEGRRGWRCSAEPVEAHLRKGGEEADTIGRKCLCNALMANVGLGQVRQSESPEPTLVTSGDDIKTVSKFLSPGASSYRAKDVIRRLLAKIER